MILLLFVAAGFATILSSINCQPPWEQAESDFDPEQFENFYAPAERRRLIKAQPSLVPVITFKNSASSFSKESNELDIGSSSFSAVKAGRSSRTARTLDGPSREPRHWMLDELNNQDLASSSIGQDAAVVTAYDPTKDWNPVQKAPVASTRRSEDFLETHNGGYIIPNQWRPPVQRNLFRTSDRPMFFDYRLADTQQRRDAAMQDYKRRNAIAKQKIRLREQSKSDAKPESNSDVPDSGPSDSHDAASGRVFSRVSEQEQLLRQQDFPPDFQQQDPRQRPRQFMAPPFMQQPDQFDQRPVPPQFRSRVFGRPVFDGDQDRPPLDNGFNDQQPSDGPSAYPPDYEGMRGPPPPNRPIFAGEAPQNMPMRQRRPQRPRQPPPTEANPLISDDSAPVPDPYSPANQNGQPPESQQPPRQQPPPNRQQQRPVEPQQDRQQPRPAEHLQGDRPERTRQAPPQNRQQRPLIRRPVQLLPQNPPPGENTAAPDQPRKQVQSASESGDDEGVDRSVQPWNDKTLVKRPLFNKSQRQRGPPPPPENVPRERPDNDDGQRGRPQSDPNSRRRPMPNRRPAPSAALRRQPMQQQQQSENIDGLPQSDFDKRFPVFAPDRLDGTQRKRDPVADDESNMEPGYVPVSKLRRFLYETSKLSSSSHGDLTDGIDSKKGSSAQKNKSIEGDKSEPGYGPPNADDTTDKEIKIGG